MVKNTILTIFCAIGLFALMDIFIGAKKLSDIDYKDTLSTIAFIASAIALWLNFSSREFGKNQLHHENARKLRQKFYSNNMRSFLIPMRKIQREENDKVEKALISATAELRLRHSNADEAEKYDLEIAIINTINVFEEALSLLHRNLISRDLIRLSLGKDFSFTYRAIAAMVLVYSKDGMMDFEDIKIKMERFNTKFEKIFGEVEG